MKPIILIGLVFCSITSWSSQVTAIPNMFYEHSFLTIEDTILGSTCYSIKASQNSLDCNPALMHYNQDEQLRFNLLIDKRLEDLLDYSKKIKNEDISGLVDKITKHPEATASRLAGSVWYQKNWWAIGYVPVRLKHASNIVNPAYPQVSLSLIKESEIFLRAGVGFYSIEGLTAGISLSYMNQKYIHGQEDLFDIIADPDLTKVKKNDLIRIEPGLAYRFKNDAWRPIFSVTLTHIDIYASEGSYKKLPPGMEVGLSSTPEFAKGRLITSTHYSLNEPGVEPFKRLRWGARYDFDGLYSITANVAKGDYGVGAGVTIDSLTLGFGYKNEELDFARWNSKSSESFMAELGLRF